MTERRNIGSGTPWEAKTGYSRLVKIGNFIYVAGTTASSEQGEVQAVGDIYGQADYIFRKIELALHEAGATMHDVVRTRMFITDMERWEEAARAHGEWFADIRPVATLVEVSRLIDPLHLIEIEVDAVLGSGDAIEQQM